MKRDKFLRIMLVLTFAALVANLLGSLVNFGSAYAKRKKKKEPFSEEIKIDSGVDEVFLGDFDGDRQDDIAYLKGSTLYVIYSQ